MPACQSGMKDDAVACHTLGREHNHSRTGGCPSLGRTAATADSGLGTADAPIIRAPPPVQVPARRLLKDTHAIGTARGDRLSNQPGRMSEDAGEKSEKGVLQKLSSTENMVRTVSTAWPARGTSRQPRLVPAPAPPLPLGAHRPTGLGLARRLCLCACSDGADRWCTGPRGWGSRRA
jgi:hypothetical protein